MKQDLIMAVSKTVASLICKKYFRGFSYDENSRKYSFTLNSLSTNQLSEFVRDLCRSGNPITTSEVLSFINQTVVSTSVDEEWSAIYANLLLPGEVILIGGYGINRMFREFFLMKMNSVLYICWSNGQRGDSNGFAQYKHGFVEFEQNFEFKIHSEIELAGIHFKVSMIKIQHPGNFHRLIDSFMLGPAYLENPSSNLMPFYHGLEAMHFNHSIGNNFELILNQTSEQGMSTYCLRKLLNYICMDEA